MYIYIYIYKQEELKCWTSKSHFEIYKLNNIFGFCFLIIFLIKGNLLMEDQLVLWKSLQLRCSPFLTLWRLISKTQLGYLDTLYNIWNLNGHLSKYPSIYSHIYIYIYIYFSEKNIVLDWFILDAKKVYFNE